MTKNHVNVEFDGVDPELYPAQWKSARSSLISGDALTIGVDHSFGKDESVAVSVGPAVAVGSIGGATDVIEVGDLVTVADHDQRGWMKEWRAVVKIADAPSSHPIKTVDDRYFQRKDVKLLARARHIDAAGLPRVGPGWGNGTTRDLVVTSAGPEGVRAEWEYGNATLRFNVSVDQWFRDFRPVDMPPAATPPLRETHDLTFSDQPTNMPGQIRVGAGDEEIVIDVPKGSTATEIADLIRARVEGATGTGSTVTMPRMAIGRVTDNRVIGTFLEGGKRGDLVSIQMGPPVQTISTYEEAERLFGTGSDLNPFPRPAVPAEVHDPSARGWAVRITGARSTLARFEPVGAEGWAARSATEETASRYTRDVAIAMVNEYTPEETSGEVVWIGEAATTNAKPNAPIRQRIPQPGSWWWDDGTNGPIGRGPFRVESANEDAIQLSHVSGMAAHRLTINARVLQFEKCFGHASAADVQDAHEKWESVPVADPPPAESAAKRDAAQVADPAAKNWTFTSRTPRLYGFAGIPAVRAGQSWRRALQPHHQGEELRAIPTGALAEILDIDEAGGACGVVLARVEGKRVRLNFGDVQHWFHYESGPTEPETPREALERVIRLEAELPPDGVTAGAWLAYLVKRAEIQPSRLVDGAAVALNGPAVVVYSSRGKVERDLAAQIRQAATGARAEPAMVPPLPECRYGRVRNG